MLVSDELNKRGRGRNPKYTARAQPVRHPRRGWHGLGPDAGTWRSPQVLSPTKAVDKVRALPELRQQDAAQYIGRCCRAQLVEDFLGANVPTCGNDNSNMSSTHSFS